MSKDLFLIEKNKSFLMRYGLVKYVFFVPCSCQVIQPKCSKGFALKVHELSSEVGRKQLICAFQPEISTYASV